VHVDEVLGAQDARQLAAVHLGEQHLRVGAQDLAEVGGQRVEVVQVRAGDLAPALAHAPHAGAQRARAGAPADDEKLGAVLVVDDDVGTSMPATLAARSSVMRAWLAAP